MPTTNKLPAKKPATTRLSRELEMDNLLRQKAELAAGPVLAPFVHPADELSAIREEIKIMQGRADELRDILLKEGADLNGDQHLAVIQSRTRETLDRKAITEAFGEAAVAPFLKTTNYKQVDLVEK